MSNYNKIIPTLSGNNLLVESIKSKKPLIFTKIALGDGTLRENESIESLTALKHLMAQNAVQLINSRENGEIDVIATISNASVTSGFYARELGVFAKVGDTGTEKLFAYTNAGAQASYTPAGTSLDEKLITVTFYIGNDVNVKINLNSQLYVTQAALDAHNTSLNAHSELFSKYLPLTGGTLTGDTIIENGKWMIYQNGEYEGSIRITQSGTMDVGVNSKGLIDNLNLCTKNKPGWYNGNGAAKPIAITEDINNHNTDETAHKSITSMIAKILGGSDWKANPAASLKDIKNLLGMGGIVAQRLEETGFIKFANGLIIQWGVFRRVVETEQGGNWNEKQQVRRFPIQFATNKAILICGDSGVYSGDNALAAAVPGAFSVRGRIVDRTSFKIAIDASDGTINADVSYIAVGI